MAVCCCAGTVPVEARPENHTETTVSTSHPEKRNTESKEASGTEFVFDLQSHIPAPRGDCEKNENLREELDKQWHIYGDIPVAKVVFESDHFLGEGIAKKWDTFVHNYTHEYDMSVGFSDTSVEIVKPAVYKAVNKVNKYYKKAVNKNQISRDAAITNMAHILDCANVICFEQDTQTLEQALRSADRPEAIIALFDKVKLRKH